MGNKKTTEDRIIEFLASGGNTSSDIHQHLNNHKKITKQSLYEQLRKLISEEILIKVKDKYFLSIDWIESLRGLLKSFDAPILSEGESIIYSFKGLHHLNSYWKHLFYYYSSLHKNVPVCAYDKYPFWEHLVDQDENNQKYARLFKNKKQKVYFLIGRENKNTLEFKKRNSDSLYKINCRNVYSFNDRNYYVIFGDTILTSIIPKSFTDKLRDLYENEDSVSDIHVKIQDHISQVSKSSLKIERNKAKADKLKKTILKDFVISSQEKSELF